MNEIEVFKNEQFGEIRTLTIDCEPWFAGKDVASVLGYRDTVNALKSHVDDEDKMRWQITTTSRGAQSSIIINESGLYSLILSSKLPSAKAFKHWVTSKVLPSLKKHGAYITAKKMTEIIQEPNNMIKLFETLRDEMNERKRLQEENALLVEKTKYYDEIINNPGTVAVTKISKGYGM